MRRRTTEIRHFSRLLASLMVTAARARSVEQLAEVHAALEEAFVDVFSLLLHDAHGGIDEILLDLARSAGRDGVRA